MAEDFAEAFRRYWMLIVSVVGGMIFVGQMYVQLNDRIDAANAAIASYGVSRQLLLEGINDHFSRIDKRLDALEKH